MVGQECDVGGEACGWAVAHRESLIDRLAAGVAEAAEREPDPERKRTLR